MAKLCPMLAVAIEDLSKLKYPILVTEKLDGIRCLIMGGKAVTRSLKPIPNDHIRNIMEFWASISLGKNTLLDGELMIEGATFSETSSGVMSKDGEPKFSYKVFDIAHDFSRPYVARMGDLQLCELPAFMEKITPRMVKDENALLNVEAEYLAAGYEGVMIRSLEGPYKFGRSTLKEGYLLKLKRFQDSEALIIGKEELMSNQNEATIDALGHTERSQHKANLVPMGVLGSLLVRDIKTGVEFSIGTGFTAQQRRDFWNYELGSAIVKYRFQPTGVKDKPRFPIFISFRDPRDL